jgi:hypothetical protein
MIASAPGHSLAADTATVAALAISGASGNDSPAPRL